MSADSPIEWTRHTFNPWWGCVRVSPGCEHCYAETLAARYGQAVWGPAKTTGRRIFSHKHWLEPLKWDAVAALAGERHRVFCASMADVFEEGEPQLAWERAKLWQLIQNTPHLDWLLLTKRPENIGRMLPDKYWPNIWLGTSTEDQRRADERVPVLLRLRSRVPVLFLSCEPLLASLDLTPWLSRGMGCDGMCDEDAPGTCRRPEHRLARVNWIIAGGESGPKARPMHPAWARSLQRQCQAAGVAYFLKQWGQWQPICPTDDEDPFDKLMTAGVWDRHLVALDEQGYIAQGENDPICGNWCDYQPAPGSWWMAKVGKKAAGRELDGRTWDEYPDTTARQLVLA